MRKRFLTEMLGWYGVVAIVGANALLNLSVLDADSISFQTLNLTGALGIMRVAFSKKDYQPATHNAIWAITAFIALGRILF